MKRRRGGDSEDEREELARARRERARRARADLAAKAKGEKPDEGAKGEEKGAKPAEDAAAEEKGAKPAGDAKGERKEAEPGKDAKGSAESEKSERAKRREALKERDEARKRAEERKRPKSDKRETTRKRRSSRRDEPETDDGKKPKKARSKRDEEGSSGDEKRKREEGTKRKLPIAGKRVRGADAKPKRTRGAGAKPKRSRGAAANPKRSRGAKPSRASRTGKSALVAFKQGAAETGKRAHAAAPKAGNAVIGLVVGAFAIFFAGLGYVLRFLIAVYLLLAPPIRAALRFARRVIEAISRQVTPVRVLALVVAGAAVLLALSQFAVYRDISIGNDAYADGIQTVAPAPVRETADTGSAHSYLMVPLAAVSLIVLGAAMTGRWRLCRLIALAGVVAIAVGLLHDRPTGLDPGQEAELYTGVKATLLGGFYAQLFSGLLLTLSSLLLGRELRLAGAQRKRPARASRGSRVRRRLLRRNPGVEGARA